MRDRYQEIEIAPVGVFVVIPSGTSPFIPGHLYSLSFLFSSFGYLVNAINQNPIAENACISPTHLLPWQHFSLLFICQATSVEINSFVFAPAVLSVWVLIHSRIFGGGGGASLVLKLKKPSRSQTLQMPILSKNVSRTVAKNCCLDF